MRTRAQGGTAADVDVAYLAGVFELAEPEVQTLLDQPTAELVHDFLQSITTKAQEFDSLQAEKLRLEVELENTIRSSDAKVKAQKAAVTRQANEVEELRKKLNESESARETLATEAEQLRSSTSGTTAETQTLRQRIESLESSNRDALALVESKTAEKDSAVAELSELHAKLLKSRTEVSELEQANQSLEDAASQQKFKEHNLQQEIAQLKKNNEWHANELQTRTQEYTKFRKERNARISSLERELEDSNATAEALKRTEKTLRQRLEEVQGKADDAFARIASLQEEAARKEQGLRAEVDGSKRLAELQAQNAATHKARLQEVNAQVDQLKDDAAEEIGRLQAEVETERADKESVERTVAELEMTVERLQQQQVRSSRPGTPLRNGGMEPHTPGRLGSRAGSPSALAGSMRKSVGGLSFTQLYSNWTECQAELEDERRRTNKLASAMDELITQMENKKPEIEDLRAEHDRLEGEVTNFSHLLDEANQNRDIAVKETERYRSEADVAIREGQILRQQLRDLSAQLRMLMVDSQAREQGLAEMSAEERFQLERHARGELDDSALEGMSSTGQWISERLVLFRDVSELQAQNEKLLRLTRELGEKMEGEEAREQARQSASDAQEVEELRQQVDRYKDEIRSTATQMESYVKERDMFRRMLQHRGQLAPDADLQAMFGQSMGPGTPQRNSLAPQATPRKEDDWEKLFREQQVHFDQYREESTTDRRQLKDQADNLTREKSTLQADIARAQSQLDLATQRYDMLQSNFNMARDENTQLQNRYNQLGEQAAKQGALAQQLAEDLQEANGKVESFRTDLANAKAEKELWKRIEARLTEDNKNLMEERSRLNKNLIDLQNLQNERVLTESETRRRVESRIETLETELSSTKKKLDAERDESRKAALRREYEEGQSRTRIDDLVKSLGNVREELVAAKTTRDQLQSRVDEIKIELRAAEEKVTALQPRPTPRAEPSTQNGQAKGDGEELSNEQRLAIEASELRRDLELSKGEVESVKQQIENYKSIAQSSEEELANLAETSDQYKEDMDAALAEKDAKIAELSQRIEDINSELTTSNNELSELRAKADDSSRLLNEQKASFESELARLRDDIEGHDEAKSMFQQDIKAQAEIAQQAQQSYEEELLKHAEAAKSLHAVRKEYNDLRTQVAGIRAESEAAKANLERGEESWAEQRERFERELEEVKRRRQDVDQQNKLLHQQMESFSAELAALRQGRAANSADSQGSPSVSGGDNNYQEVIKFLRREKEIVDVQYELSIQESKRLQQQLDYANTQLEEARQKLSDERRQSADKVNSEASTSKLTNTINELNVFRESATTLRNEAKQYREKLEEKSNEVDRLFSELEPLKGRVGELEGELESKAGEMKLLQDDRDHWRERTQNIISKYDRVDPAELEGLKNQLEELKAEKERLETEQAPMQEQIDGFEARLEEEKSTVHAAQQTRIDTIKKQAKDQDTKRKEAIARLTQEQKTIQTALDTANSELEETKTKLDEANAALGEARANSKPADDDAEEGQVQEDGLASGNEELAALQARLVEAENRVTEQVGRADGLAVEVQTLETRVQEFEVQISDLQQQLETAQTINVSSAEAEATTTPAADSETLDKLKQDLATAQQEVETLRANASVPSEPVVNAEPAAGEKSVAEQVAEGVATLRSELEEQHQKALAAMEEKTKARIETMKKGLTKQLHDGRAKQRDDAQAEVLAKHSEEIQQLKNEHAAAIEKLKGEHKAELEKLAKTGGAAVEKAEVKSEAPKTDVDLNSLELSPEQAKQLVKSSKPIQELLKANIINKVDQQTSPLKAQIAEKDAEIERLKSELEKLPSAPVGGATTSDTVTRAELERQLETAKQEKEAAVRQAVDAAEKKVKLQLNMRDIAVAKIKVVEKAAAETPEKPVKEVWDVAAKARPTTAAATPAKSTPAPASAKPAIPSSPTPGSAPTDSQSSQASGVDKLKAPGQRFGAASASSSATPAQGTARPAPSGPAATQAGGVAPGKRTVAPPTTGAPRRLSSSGIPAPGSKLPTPGSRPGSVSGSAGTSIKGSANAPARGGASGVPRGGGRGGFGAPSRGAQANAGQKRQHDGSDAGDGNKRMRGGAQGGGSG